jgi:hypothetical protein
LPRGFAAGRSFAAREPVANFAATPGEAMKPTFVEFCFGHLKPMMPIVRWLLDETSKEAAAP